MNVTLLQGLKVKSSLVNANSNTTNNLEDLLKARNYLKGKETKFYILTIKDFEEKQTQGPFRYFVLVLEKDKLIKQDIVEHKTKKQLLTPAKRRGIQLLLEHFTQITSEIVTMSHYKPDRQSIGLWVKESKTSLESLITEERFQILKRTAESDIEAEKSQ